MVGTNYDRLTERGPTKRNVTVFGADKTRLGTYPVRPSPEGYELVWRGESFPLLVGESGPDKGRFYLRRTEDVERLRSKT